MPMDRASIVAHAAGMPGVGATAKPPPMDAERDGTDASLRIVFDPMASFEARKRAFMVAVEMATKHKSREDAKADVESGE